MKTKPLTVAFAAILLLGLSANAFAQSMTSPADRSQKLELLPPILIKNLTAEALDVADVKIDERIVKYYPAGDLEDISKEKAIKLSHIYLDSYQILYVSDQNEACQTYLQETFDLGEYNHLRLEDKRVNVEVNVNDCFFKVALFSWNEIDEMR